MPSDIRFPVDECLSSTLADRAQDVGFEATHVVRQGWGSLKDPNLAMHIVAVGDAFVTNSRLDFLRLHGRMERHAGLVVIVPNVGKRDQQTLFGRVLDYIEALPAAVLSNAVLEIQADGEITLKPLSLASAPIS